MNVFSALHVIFAFICLFLSKVDQKLFDLELDTKNKSLVSDLLLQLTFIFQEGRIKTVSPLITCVLFHYKPWQVSVHSFKIPGGNFFGPRGSIIAIDMLFAVLRFPRLISLICRGEGWGVPVTAT